MPKFGWFGGLGVTQGHQQNSHLIQRIFLSDQPFKNLEVGNPRWQMACWVLCSCFVCAGNQSYLFHACVCHNYNLLCLTCMSSRISDSSDIAYLSVCMNAFCYSVTSPSGSMVIAGINLLDYLFVCKCVYAGP